MSDDGEEGEGAAEEDLGLGDEEDEGESPQGDGDNPFDDRLYFAVPVPGESADRDHLCFELLVLIVLTCEDVFSEKSFFDS